MSTRLITEEKICKSLKKVASTNFQCDEISQKNDHVEERELHETNFCKLRVLRSPQKMNSVTLFISSWHYPAGQIPLGKFKYLIKKIKTTTALFLMMNKQIIIVMDNGKYVLTAAWHKYLKKLKCMHSSQLICRQ